jgi:flagellar hook-associated protein 2
VAIVQFGGLITGIDTNALIEGLVQAEQRPIELLQNQKVRFEAQDGVLTSLVSALAALKSSGRGLSLSTDFHRKAAASSDATVLKASADSTAEAGAFRVAVDALAKAQSVRSSTFATATDAIGTGTLTLTVGEKETTVTVDATNKTLTGLKNAINASGAAVTASIVNVGTGASPDFRLVVQSKQTGTENAVTISGNLAGGTNPFAGGGEIVQTASNALFSVSGLAVTRSTNTISDVVPGVTFTLLKEGDADGIVESTDVSSEVTVSADGSTLNATIKKFVEDFNAVNKIVNDQFSLDPDSNRQGALGGDASLRGIISRLRKELSAPGGIGVGFRFLSDIGIRFQDDGSLTIDDAKLSSALAANPDGVSDLFTLVENGIGKRIPDAVDDFISSVDGSLTFRQKGIRASIENIDRKVAIEQERIAAFQARLTQQFTALERLVSQLRSQGDFLTQRLALIAQQNS